MNTTTITALLALDDSTSRLFRGCLAADEFRRVFVHGGVAARGGKRPGDRGPGVDGDFGDRTLREVPDDELYVVNTDPSTLSGTHWTVVYRRDGRVYFFDPYGVPARAYPSIYPTIAADAPISNSTPLQTDNTDVCGDYCVLYALTVAEDIHPEAFAAFWERVDPLD